MLSGSAFRLHWIEQSTPVGEELSNSGRIGHRMLHRRSYLRCFSATASWRGAVDEGRQLEAALGRSQPKRQADAVFAVTRGTPEGRDPSSVGDVAGTQITDRANHARTFGCWCVALAN
jgi:hypothetical protein